MTSLGDAITTLRQARGLSQTELASQIGVTQVALHRYEAGEREPSPEKIRLLSDALGVTDDFLRHEFRLRGGVAQDAHMRKRKTTRAGDWKLVEARLNELRMMSAYFLQRAPLKLENTVPDVDMDEMTPTEAAQLTRARWQMPAGPVIALTPWLESAGIIVISEEFPSKKIDGMSQWGKESAVMIVNSLAPSQRRRLTMAHELGHLVMHDQVLGGDDEVEAQANEFAAEFLMPAHAIRNELRSLAQATPSRTVSTLFALKQTWGVSMQALYERAYALGVVSQSQRQQFYKLMSSKGWRTSEPGDDLVIADAPRLAPSVGESLRNGGLKDAEILTLLGTRDARRAAPFLSSPRRIDRSHLRVI